jgi:arginine/lysine/ornithine decarboxylase
VRSRLLENRDIKALHVTSPSYYGFCIDLVALRGLANEAGVPLIVDEAHGTHFALHQGFPRSALSSGADLVVQSPHKTLGSFTQSSLLHHQGRLVDPDRLDSLLQMLQSSSPSALLLVSLDLALREMAEHGATRWGATIELAERLRAAAGAIPGLSLYGEELLERPAVAAFDPTKLVVDVQRLALNGPAAARFLVSHYGIHPEFSDLRRMVFSLTTGDDASSAALLLDALAELAADAATAPLDEEMTSLWPGEVPEMALTPRQGGIAAARPRIAVPLAQSERRVAAEMVVPYPPGIPLLVPGEVINAELLAAIGQLVALGCRIVGMADASAKMILCLDEVAGRGGVG